MRGLSRLVLLSVTVFLSCAVSASDQVDAEGVDGSDESALFADNRRKERRGDRQDDRDDRQDCRQEEGRIGDDKRECKQEQRGEVDEGEGDDGEGEAEEEGGADAEESSDA